MKVMLEPGRAAAPWVSVARPRPRGVRLFCLPYAGGGVSAFRGWADLLPQVEVAPIQLPGRESRIGESPVVDLDALTDAVVPYTDRPYAVFGHSFGARLGFELCRRLRAGAAPAPVWLFASGCQAPQLPPLHPPASVLGDDELIARLTALGGTPPEVLADPELRDLALPALRADLTYVDAYVYQAEPPLDCPITVFGGDQDPETRPDGLFGWGEHTTGAFAVRTLPGDHFFLHSARRQLLGSVASDLATGPAGTSRVSVPVLEPGEVHVWYARTDELALPDGVLRDSLSDEERVRADAFRFRRDAVRSVRRRWLLRRLRMLGFRVRWPSWVLCSEPLPGLDRYVPTRPTFVL
jgi:medium-chain acyl-[acyl-carrier-protein] hydrolase